MIQKLLGVTMTHTRLFIIVLIPAVLLRLDAELGYRWQAWFNDSFQYVQNTVTLNLDPTRVSGYSLWLKLFQVFHTYAIITILQHLMALATAVMIYALARHRFGAPWSEIDDGAEPALRFVAIEHLQELLLVRHRARLSPRRRVQSLRCRRGR